MESGVDFIMYDSYPNFAYAMDRPDGGEGDLKDRILLSIWQEQELFHRCLALWSSRQDLAAGI